MADGTGAGRFELAALDMDGTLLNTAHETTVYTCGVLARASAAGKVIAVCTGRCLSELWAHLEAIPGIGYAICENGGCLYDVKAKRILEKAVIPEADADRVLDAARDLDVCVQCFIGDQSYMRLGEAEELKRYHIYDFWEVFRAGSVFVRDMDALRREVDRPVEKINLYFTTAAERDRFAEKVGEIDLNMSASLGIGYEISPREAAKGLGLQKLCRHLGIPVERAMAVGDGGNDIDLMSAAGFAVAMGNAIDEVRRLADAFTEDCDHDGAARAVERWLLGGAEA